MSEELPKACGEQGESASKAQLEMLHYDLVGYTPKHYYITLKDDFDGKISRFNIDRQVAKHINEMRQEIYELRKENEQLQRRISNAG